MPSIQQDKQALDWLAKNPTDQYAPAVAQKLGVEAKDVDAWRWADENPADMRAIQVRNKVFDRVAESRPSQVSEQGGEIKNGVPIDRLAVTNLLDNDRNAQKTYFEKKGYKVREDTKGDLSVKGPGENYYKAIDPKGIDRWDAADILSDVAAGVAVGSTAIKGAGPVGAFIGYMGGAVAGGATEGLKQAIAKKVGARDDYNAGEIARQALIGGLLPPALDAFGGALKYGGKQVGKAVTYLTGSGLKPNAKEIEQAAEAIGAKATPGQLFEGKVVQSLESTMQQKAGLIGGTGLRKQIDKNVKAVKATAQDLVSEASARSSREVGEDIGRKLTDAVEKRLAPAEAIYTKYEASLKDAPVDVELVTNVFNKIKTANELNPEVNAAIGRFETVVDKVKSLDDLKTLGSNVGAAARVADANRNWPLARGLRDLQAEIREARSQSIVNHFDEVPGLGDMVRSELASADKIYRETIADLSDVISRNLSKGSPKKELQSFLEKTPTVEVVDKVFKTGNPDQLIKLQNSFPDVFEAARTSKLAEIAERSMVKGEINPQKLAKAINAMEPESQVLLFGVDGAKKAKQLSIYLNSLPERVGPSGTPEGIRWHDLMNIMNPAYYIRQVGSLGLPALSHVYTAAPLGKDMLTKTGSALQKRTTKGAAVGAVNLLPQTKEK